MLSRAIVVLAACALLAPGASAQRLEAEDLEVVRTTAGDHGVQEMDFYAPLGTFGGDKVVHWFGQENPGDLIEFQVPVPKAGKYRITLGIVKSWDYGIFQPMIDGKDVGRPLDLYSNGPEEKAFAAKVDLGVVDVKREHILLAMRFTGTNPQSKSEPNPGSMGLDWVMLTRVTETSGGGTGTMPPVITTGSGVRIEAEDIEEVTVSAGDRGIAEMEPYAPLGTFGGDKVVHWFGQENPGDRIEFKVPVRKPGKYRITLGIVKSWDYGIFQPMIDGKDVGKPLDLYSNGPEEKAFAGKVDLGVVDVKREHILLGMRFTGTNPQSKSDPNPGSMGLDWVMLTPVTETAGGGTGTTPPVTTTGSGRRYEAEDLTVVRTTAGDHATYEMTDFAPAGTFGADKAVHWFGQGKVGDLIQFRVPVAKPGSYRLILGLVKSWDYGIFQTLVDGKVVGKPIDLYSAGPEEKCFPVRVDVGVIEVKREHILLAMRYTGVNPKSKPEPNPRSMGIDWVQLVPVAATPGKAPAKR